MRLILSQVNFDDYALTSYNYNISNESDEPFSTKDQKEEEERIKEHKKKIRAW